MELLRLKRVARTALAALAVGLTLVSCGGGGGTSDPIAPAALPPQITTQPQAPSAADGAPAFFSVAASGNGLSYQWQRNSNPVAGATGNTLTLPAVALADDGARFAVVVSNAGGSVTSDAVTLTVTPVTPSIVTAPLTVTVMAGETASYSVVARGSAPLGYQWLRNGAEIAGATSASYTTGTMALADDGSQFAVRVGNAAGSVTSAAAGLTVQPMPLPPSIAAQPQPASVGAGQTATFSVTASGTAPLSYQWRRNGNVIAGATAASFTTPAAASTDNGDIYSVVVGNAVGSVTSAGAILTVAASPGSPLSGRAWTPVVQLAPGVFDGPLAGLADDGAAVVVGATDTPIATFPFRELTPFVILGEPGGSGAVRWSAARTLSTFGTRSGEPVPTDLRVTALRVAPNGRAVIMATGSGGGCPGSQPGLPTACRFVSVLDPVLRTWTPWDVMALLEESQRDDFNVVALNDRGDLAAYFPARGALDPVARVFWRGATEASFRTFAIPPNGALSTQTGNLTLDESGGLVLAAELNQNATVDIGVWRGDVATGFRPPLVADTRAAPAAFRTLWTGRSGRSFLMWTQSNGTTNTLFGTRFDAASATIVAEDLGPTLLSTLPTRLRGTVSDADILIVPRYNGSASITTCATLRWPFVGSLDLADAPAPCSVTGAVAVDWGGERDGNVLSTNPGFSWATYDASLNRQVDAPIDTSAIASGPGYVIGVRRPQGIRSYTTALSRSGIGLVVITANLDTWPTPATPNGDGRPNVANLWATYFK
jgi:Immunoglobulin I-set domain